jgi:hypothetical protein
MTLEEFVTDLVSRQLVGKTRAAKVTSLLDAWIRMEQSRQIQPTLSMVEPAPIPEQYCQTVREFLSQYWEGRRWEMQESFGFYQLPILTNDQLLHTPLAHGLAMIARAAAGEISGGDLNRGTIHEGIQSLMEDLYCPRGLNRAYDIPARFYDTPLGQMVARAWMWLQGDELITLAEAAEMRGVTIPAMSQAVKNGRLTRYVDPNAGSRQGRTLVSRAEVEGMDDG